MRSSIPPPLTISSAIASFRFQAATTSPGRPGPGTRAAGAMVPPAGGGVTVALTAGAVPAEGVELPPVIVGAVAPDEPVALRVDPGAVDAAVFELGLFFFMFIMKKRPTTTTRTPTTAIWTVGLSLSAFLIGSRLPRAHRRRCRRSARS